MRSLGSRGKGLRGNLREMSCATSCLPPRLLPSPCRFMPRRRQPDAAADLRTRLRQPQPFGPSSPRGQAVARRQVADGAARARGGQRPLRFVGLRASDGRVADAGRQREGRQRPCLVRGGEDAARAPADRQAEGHRRLRLGAQWQRNPGAPRRRSLPRRARWQHPASHQHARERIKSRAERDGQISLLRSRQPRLGRKCRRSRSTACYTLGRARHGELGRSRIRRAGGVRPDRRAVVVARRSPHRGPAHRRGAGRCGHPHRHRGGGDHRHPPALSRGRNGQRYRPAVLDGSRMGRTGSRSTWARTRTPTSAGSTGRRMARPFTSSGSIARRTGSTCSPSIQ